MQQPIPQAVEVRNIQISCSLGNSFHAVKERFLEGQCTPSFAHRFKGVHQAPVGEMDWLSHGIGSDSSSDRMLQTIAHQLVDAAANETGLFERCNKAALLVGTTTVGIEGFLNAAKTIKSGHVQKAARPSEHGLKSLSAEQKEDSLLSFLSPSLQQHLLADTLLESFPFAWAHTLSSSCAASAQAIHLARKLLLSESFDAVVVLGTDILNPITLGGFESLQIVDPQPCRPFSESRNGINLGEACVVLVLEREAKLKHPSLGRIAGSHTLSESFHMTQPDPSGNWMQKCMEEALLSCAWKPEEIAYLNPHATGTLANDGAEMKAIQKVFGTLQPRIETTKNLTGHTLGACGALECALSLFRLESLSQQSQKQENKFRGLSNSFGFGGVFATLALEVGS